MSTDGESTPERDTGSPATRADPGGCWCSACRRPVPGFEAYGLPPRPGRCPRCGAKPRHRAVLGYLARVVAPRLGPGSRVLEVGGARLGSWLHPRPQAIGAAWYLAGDVRALDAYRRLPAPNRFVRLDIGRAPLADASFDVVLCNNTLPYVAEDQRALSEIRRCLRTDGIAMLNTHRRPGPTLRAREFARHHPELGEEWYAENGDQWVYGDDFLDRLRAADLQPREDPLHPPGTPPALLGRLGLKAGATCLVAFRSRAGAIRFPPAKPGPRLRLGRPVTP